MVPIAWCPSSRGSFTFLDWLNLPVLAEVYDFSLEILKVYNFHLTQGKLETCWLCLSLSCKLRLEELRRPGREGRELKPGRLGLSTSVQPVKV